MTDTATQSSIESTERQLVTNPDSSRAWWFLGTLAVLRNPVGSPRTPAVIELTVPPGGSPPRPLVRVNAEHDSRIVGPSLGEELARAIAGADRASMELGPVHHVSLAVTDLLRSERWYVTAFGCVRVDGEVTPNGTGHLVLANPLGGWLLTLSTATSAGVEHLPVACRDRQMLVDWQNVLGERGVTPGSITYAPYGSGFVVRDPDGMELELFAPPLV